MSDIVIGLGRVRDELVLYLFRVFLVFEIVVFGFKEGLVGECEIWCFDCFFIIIKGDKM